MKTGRKGEHFALNHNNEITIKEITILIVTQVYDLTNFTSSNYISFLMCAVCVISSPMILRLHAPMHRFIYLVTFRAYFSYQISLLEINLALKV